MILEHCNMKMVSERGGAIVEFTESPEPNIIEMVFRNESGDKVRVTLDIKAAIDAAITRRMQEVSDIAYTAAKLGQSTFSEMATDWIEKLHSTCKHSDKFSGNEYPCSECFKFDRWEADK